MMSEIWTGDGREKAYFEVTFHAETSDLVYAFTTGSVCRVDPVSARKP
jgi:hypothetical protein